MSYYMSFEYQNHHFNKYINLYKGTYELMHWQRYLDMSKTEVPRDILSMCYVCGKQTSNVITKVHELQARGYLFCCSEECFTMWLLR